MSLDIYLDLGDELMIRAADGPWCEVRQAIDIDGIIYAAKECISERQIQVLLKDRDIGLLVLIQDMVKRSRDRAWSQVNLEDHVKPLAEIVGG